MSNRLWDSVTFVCVGVCFTGAVFCPFPLLSVAFVIGGITLWYIGLRSWPLDAPGRHRRDLELELEAEFISMSEDLPGIWSALCWLKIANEMRVKTTIPVSADCNLRPGDKFMWNNTMGVVK